MRSTANIQYRVLDTAAGHVAFTASPAGLRRVYLPEPSPDLAQHRVLRDHAAAVRSDQLLPRFTTQLRRFFAGEAVDFGVELDCDGAAPFEQRVWQVCREIPYGQTLSYAQLAARAGRPRAARAVGNAMRHNRFPFVVPCHRVVRSDGSLGGYAGKSGLAFKQDLLDMEANAAGCAV